MITIQITTKASNEAVPPKLVAEVPIIKSLKQYTSFKKNCCPTTQI